MKHTFEELKQWQSLPLSVKVLMTKARIREWIKTYGEDGVYISFSGGKDSTVLLDLVRQDYPNVPALFVDVPTQYPELREFATSFPNVDVVKPNLTFMQVCEKYGFPLISKEVSEKAYYAQKYLKWYLSKNEIEPPSAYGIADLLGILDRKDERYKDLKRGELSPELLEQIFGIDSKAPFKAKALMGTVRHKENGIETDEDRKYKTTGCSRTGCMLCGFGCHLEKSPNRFEQLKETHPGMYKLLDVVKNNGVTMREAIEWMNENGGTDIKL